MNCWEAASARLIKFRPAMTATELRDEVCPLQHGTPASPGLITDKRGAGTEVDRAGWRGGAASHGCGTMMSFSWLMERFSRSLLNKRLLRDFLKEELDERQTRVVGSERALYLFDLQLRTDTLDDALPEGSGLRVVSATIDQLVIKFPTFADMQRQSGLVEVAAKEIKVEVETWRQEEKDACDSAARQTRQELAASLAALRAAMASQVQSAYQDAPDGDLEASHADDGGWGQDGLANDGGTAGAFSAGLSGCGSVRSNLERLIEKALGATRLSLDHLHVTLALRAPRSVAAPDAAVAAAAEGGEMGAAEAAVSMHVRGLVVTNHDSSLDGWPPDTQGPGMLVCKKLAVDSISLHWLPQGTAGLGGEEGGGRAGGGECELMRVRGPAVGGMGPDVTGLELTVQYRHAACPGGGGGVMVRACVADVRVRASTGVVAHILRAVEGSWMRCRMRGGGGGGGGGASAEEFMRHLEQVVWGWMWAGCGGVCVCWFVAAVCVGPLCVVCVSALRSRRPRN